MFTTYGLDTEGIRNGIYRHEGDLYVVVPNREKTHSYAMCVVDHDYRVELVYEQGMMSVLAESERISSFGEFTEVEVEVLARYGKCFWCKHKLRHDSSIGRMIGPQCSIHLGLVKNTHHYYKELRNDS